jgi:hypothetical protein
MATGDWAAVEAEVRRIVASELESPFTAETIAQVESFLRLARNRCLAPTVGKGHWSTISFAWTTTTRGPLEIEVFDDRLEIYRFPEGRIDVRYVYHLPGAEFPANLLTELPTCPDSEDGTADGTVHR